jgi:putative transcriptional regulator
VSHAEPPREEPPIDVRRAPLTRGSLLVALPSLTDPNFTQSVVLLCDAGSEEGAMGIVVNRPTPLQLAEALPQETLLKGHEIPVYLGGPVQTDRILLLVRAEEPAEGFVEVLDGVALGGTLDALKEAATGQGITGEFRPYRGYAGWGPGQLEAEIEQGAWLLLPGDVDLVFSRSPLTVWQDLMARVGGPLEFYATMPPDLSMN